MKETECLWDRLKTKDKPIVLYGMGNGADKIIRELNKRDIKVSGVFANDEFVRGQDFNGFHVMTYDEAVNTFKDMIVLLSFGSHLPNVIERIKYIASKQELYAPDVPVAGNGVFDGLFFDLHKKEILKARDLLSDDKSKDVFDKIIEYKLDGKIDHLFDCETDDEENWNLLGLSGNEKYLDIGAYNGDTIRQFIKLVGTYDGIMAVEPEPHSFRKLSEYVSSKGNISLYNVAIGKEKGEALFDTGNGRGSSLGKGKPVFVDCIDNICGEKGVSFIKIDAEGEEASALIGGTKTVKANTPKMLIAAYHRVEDIFDVPLRVNEIFGGYRIYLRHTPCLPAWEVNYYFVPEKLL